MRSLLLVTTLVAGCVSSDSDEPISTGGAPGKADGSDPDVIALMDPNRPSAAYECAGTPLTADELVELFAPGYGIVQIGTGAADGDSAARYSPRVHTLSVRRYTRTCTGLSGCSTWSSRSVDTMELGFALMFRDDTVESLAAQAFSATGLQLNSDTTRPVSAGDFVLLPPSPAAASSLPPRRVRITRDAAGELCISAATTQRSSGGVPETQEFLVAHARFRTPPAGSAPDAPAFDDTGACTAAEQDAAALARAWLPPGGSSVTFPQGECPVASRSCHPVTGCSAWWRFSNCINGPRVSSLQIAPSGTEMAVQLYNVGNSTLAVLDGGQFTDVAHGVWQVTGVANATCIGWEATSASTGPYGESSTSQTVGRINR